MATRTSMQKAETVIKSKPTSDPNFHQPKTLDCNAKIQACPLAIESIIKNASEPNPTVTILCPDEQMYVFIPGKNWKLSLAELITYLQTRKINFKVTDLSKPFFIIESRSILDPKIVDNLGGTIKAGKVLSQMPSETVEDAFLHKKEHALAEIRSYLLSDHVFNNLFGKPLTKNVFGASIYFENPRFLHVSKKIQRFVGSCLKDELASQGTKARFMGFPQKRRLPQLTHVEVLKKGLAEQGKEILFCISKAQTFISKTASVHNPFEFQKRDISRPVQRKIYSIPPRLAKIMINLSTCLPGEALLDPFCGVGTILQEALLLKAQVTGIDIDPWCVNASRTNLQWLTNEYGLKEAKYTILSGDSRNLTDKVNRETIDCIVTEPNLGPPLRHFPTDSYARRMAGKLKLLYHSFLKGAHEALRAEGTLVFVTPYVKTRSGNFITLDLEEEVKAIGFKKTYPFEKNVFADGSPLVKELAITSSLVDVGKKHKIGREINILQK